MALNLEQANSGTFCLTKVGLAIGSTTSQLSTAASAATVVNGRFQAAKGATATFAITAATGFTLTTVPIGSKAAFGVFTDGTNFFVTQGPIAAVNSNSDKVGPPPVPAGLAPVGVFTAYAATAAYVPGTTALTAAGVTATYFDLFSAPSAGF